MINLMQGLVLTGSEVKSLRINTGSIKESFHCGERGRALAWPIVILRNIHASNERRSQTQQEKEKSY